MLGMFHDSAGCETLPNMMVVDDKWRLATSISQSYLPGRLDHLEDIAVEAAALARVQIRDRAKRTRGGHRATVCAAAKSDGKK